MSDASIDSTDLTIELAALASMRGHDAGDATANKVDVTSTNADAWREMVWAADGDRERARNLWVGNALHENLAQEFGRDYIDAFNRGYFDGYVERVRRLLDELDDPTPPTPTWEGSIELPDSSPPPNWDESATDLDDSTPAPPSEESTS